MKVKLIEIDSKKFDKEALKSSEITFHQSSAWAKLKEYNGWKAYYFALEDKKKIKACALILEKELPIVKKNIWYSPRGFLLDYNDKEVLKAFTDGIKEEAKKHEAVFIKIDPYVKYKEHDNNGALVEGGFDNSSTITNLKELGYKHFGFNVMQDSLQPRWMHVIDTKGKSLDEVMEDMESKTRQILRKNMKSSVICRDITRDELPIYKEIMQKTSDRRAFIDRPLSYYEHMWDAFYDKGMLKIMIAEIDFEKYYQNTEDELKEIENAYNDRKEKYEKKLLQMNEKRYTSRQKQDESAMERLKAQLDKIKKYQKEYGKKTILGGILFLIYGNEVLSLYGGSNEELMNFQSAYSLHFEGIKYAVENKYNRYNFYGITGDFSQDNPLYGLYLFKKSFGGVVEELIGEFDLIINKPMYYLYKISYGLYHKIKNIRH
ncbi:MAG: peptidoglycan bridge formation glycyltransferase FemA/FemB family protein [Bacilli bacterium]|nr:peptidoglycan bridge formation glycyltransferase FemA/FemB family protein [Bacilli bacterium]